MGIFDKVKELLGMHDDKADQGIEKGGDAVDKKTDDKYRGQVDQGQDFLQDRTGEGDTTK